MFLYFLNDDWNEENGGNLILHTKDGNSIKVNPVFPNFVVFVMFGNDYIEIAPLLWKYALATAFFVISNIFSYYFFKLITSIQTI